MAEKKQILGLIDVKIVGIDITIKNYYKKTELPFTIFTFVADVEQKFDNINFDQGELCIKMIESPEEIDFYVNDKGYLIVRGDDADKYSIDSNGDLIYLETGYDWVRYEGEIVYYTGEPVWIQT